MTDPKDTQPPDVTDQVNGNDNPHPLEATGLNARSRPDLEQKSNAKLAKEMHDANDRGDAQESIDRYNILDRRDRHGRAFRGARGFEIGQIVEVETGEFLGELAEVRDVHVDPEFRGAHQGTRDYVRIRFIGHPTELDVHDPDWKLSRIADDAEDRPVADLSDATRRWLDTMDPAEAYHLAPTSAEHEYVYGFRSSWEEREEAERRAAEEIAAAPPAGPVPASHTEATEYLLREAGRCSYQTGYGFAGYEYCGHPGDGDTAYDGYCAFHDRAATGTEDPEIKVGDRVRDVDDVPEDGEPVHYGTVTHVDNNGFRVRWDGQEEDFDAEYGDIEPDEDAICGQCGQVRSLDRQELCEDCRDGDAGEEIAPAPGDAAARTAAPADGGGDSGETTSLSAAIGYTTRMSQSLTRAIANTDLCLVSVQAAQVTGPAIGHLNQAHDALIRGRDAFDGAHRDLTRHQVVRDAYQANPGAGTKNFLTGD